MRMTHLFFPLTVGLLAIPTVSAFAAPPDALMPTTAAAPDRVYPPLPSLAMLPPSRAISKPRPPSYARRQRKVVTTQWRKATEPCRAWWSPTHRIRIWPVSSGSLKWPCRSNQKPPEPPCPSPPSSFELQPRCCGACAGRLQRCCARRFGRLLRAGRHYQASTRRCCGDRVV